MRGKRREDSWVGCGFKGADGSPRMAGNIGITVVDKDKKDGMWETTKGLLFVGFERWIRVPLQLSRIERRSFLSGRHNSPDY